MTTTLNKLTKKKKINKNFQLIASTKNNLKIAEEEIVQGIVLATTACNTLLLGLKSTLLLGARYKSLYIYINTIYENKNQQQYWSPSLSLIIHKFGGIAFEWAHCNQSLYSQIYIKLDKVKIKPYLR